MACLVRLQALVRTSFRSEDAARATFAAMVDELTHYPPQAVTAGCLQWARQKPGWPSLAELLEFVRGNDRSGSALPDPNKPENLLARIKRVAGRDAGWIREHHDVVMAELFPRHCDGGLSDEQMARDVEAIDAGRTIHRERPMPSDAQILVAWEHNDRLGADISANPARYMNGQFLAGVFQRMRAKRFRDRPTLAASYYGERV